eukprot:7900134-Alexandrium_andersonii.AAC.1
MLNQAPSTPTHYPTKASPSVNSCQSKVPHSQRPDVWRSRARPQRSGQTGAALRGQTARTFSRLT